MMRLRLLAFSLLALIVAAENGPIATTAPSMDPHIVMTPLLLFVADHLSRTP